jgi:hypothetical protein
MQQGEDIWHIAALYNYFVLEPAYKLGDLDCYDHTMSVSNHSAKWKNMWHTLLRASSMRPPTKGA